MAEDKSKYLPMAQIQRMFAAMPDGYNKYLAAYPGIESNLQQYVKKDPESGAFMLKPPEDVEREIRAQVLAQQSMAQIHQVQQPAMQPLGSSAAQSTLSKADMIKQAQAKLGGTNG